MPQPETHLGGWRANADLHRQGTFSAPTLPGMVLIPAGEFKMGSNDAEAENDEQPVCSVYVDTFYLDETEVTNVQYCGL